ncbi:DUF5105 domain-containing protein [Weissella hellenica]|uniref:DUF5105 domain-containing protein n=1 Tax=Weissella hellenica TaxID=46256 RepID=A0A4Y4G5T0_WEIHE|nr:DUF5105 domain-containing protein [Weissella hellenica]NKY66619.1 DUF5105 domain-containing protein [Weissella hellenica]GED35191.1 hypothetical protein WHE01_00950 [Weissella hellenica]SCB94501.1 protein of unknown function [Weissella hellenica]
MKMHNKLGIAIAGFMTVSTLAGFGGSVNTVAAKASAPSNGVAVKVKSGEYIVPDNKKALASNKAYLALDLHIKNNGPKISLMTSDIKLKDKSGSRIKSVQIYGSGDDFSTMGYEKLAKRDSTSGYVVFPVTKDKKYTLEVAPMASGTNKMVTTKVKINTKKYQDHTQDSQKAVTSYVDNVFLNKQDNSSYDKVLTNKLEDEQVSYRNVARDFLETRAFNNTIADEAAANMVKQIQDMNNKKGSVKYVIKSATPTTAEITVTPTLVKLSELSSVISETQRHVDETQNANGEMSYSEVNRAVKESLVQKFPEVLEKMPMREADGQDIKLIKDGKKWTVDTSESAYSFESLQKAFSGSFN